jgi:hypothetical protein
MGLFRHPLTAGSLHEDYLFDLKCRAVFQIAKADPDTATAEVQERTVRSLRHRLDCTPRSAELPIQLTACKRAPQTIDDWDIKCTSDTVCVAIENKKSWPIRRCSCPHHPGTLAWF